MIEVLLTLLIGLIMGVGLLGVIIPVLPDMLLIWGAALGYGLLLGWGEKGPWLFGLISLLGLVGLLSEAWASGAGARIGGGSVWGILAGLVAGFIGLIFFSPLGFLVGLLLGSFTVEYMRLKDPKLAAQAVLGMGLGYGASFGIRLALGLAMMAVWLYWVFFGG